MQLEGQKKRLNQLSAGGDLYVACVGVVDTMEDFDEDLSYSQVQDLAGAAIRWCALHPEATDAH